MNFTTKRQERIYEQLGMSQGAARNRLVRSLLLKYAAMAGHDDCYRCGGKIETNEDLSIEHIEPWENRDAALFWDLENVRFSHKWCNTPHKKTDVKIMREDGFLKCYRCGEFKKPDDFSSNSSKWTGKNNTCRTCDTQKKSEYREKYGRR